MHKTVDKTRKYLQDNNIPFFSTDNIAEALDEIDLIAVQSNVEEKVQELLKALLIDVDNDYNTRDTAKRVAKMLIQETFSGRYTERPAITSFPNKNYDEIYLTGPIKIRSTCAHHFQPIVGKCWIGVFPGTNVIGLSKFNRLVDWVVSRPQIQEEMTIQIADEIVKETEAAGIAVIVKAEHMCLTMRGVKEHESDMTTSVLRGELRDNQMVKSEFFSLLQGMKGFYNGGH